MKRQKSFGIGFRLPKINPMALDLGAVEKVAFGRASLLAGLVFKVY
jgi:hypothetical protein